MEKLTVQVLKANRCGDKVQRHPHYLQIYRLAAPSLRPRLDDALFKRILVDSGQVTEAHVIKPNAAFARRYFKRASAVLGKTLHSTWRSSTADPALVSVGLVLVWTFWWAVEDLNL